MADGPSILKIVIVEDEAPARRELLRLLQRYPDVELAGEAATASAAIELIRNTRPDGVFLDVRLPDGNGFDVLNAIPRAIPVIFATAYDRYALRAFEINALDYLLKPVDPDRLDEAVRRLRTGAVPDAEPDIPEGLSDNDLLYLNLEHGRIMLRIDLIVAIEADGDYSNIHLRDSRCIYVRHTIKRWQERLPTPGFARIHRSTIINLAYLLRVDRVPGGGREVHLEHLGNPLPVSRGYAAGIDRIVSGSDGNRKA